MESQDADTRPGNYYVSVMDGARRGLLLGPYATHSEALALVDKCRNWVVGQDGKAHFYGFGTARSKSDEFRPAGLLNDKLSQIMGQEP